MHKQKLLSVKFESFYYYFHSQQSALKLAMLSQALLVKQCHSNCCNAANNNYWKNQTLSTDKGYVNIFALSKFVMHHITLCRGVLNIMKNYICNDLWPCNILAENSVASNWWYIYTWDPLWGTPSIPTPHLHILYKSHFLICHWQVTYSTHGSTAKSAHFVARADAHKLYNSRGCRINIMLLNNNIRSKNRNHGKRCMKNKPVESCFT